MATSTAALVGATALGSSAATAVVMAACCLRRPAADDVAVDGAQSAASSATLLAQIDGLYGKPGISALTKEVDRITADYQRWIERSPFMTMATAGPGGLDCSPRGDDLQAAHELVRVHDEHTLLLPDRRGNNRCDSLKNLASDPRIALLFLIPGSGNTIRVNGRATLSFDPELLASFAVQGKAPRSVVRIVVEAVYFQCARAVVRSHLWDPSRYVEPTDGLPTPGACSIQFFCSLWACLCWCSPQLFSK